MLRAVNEIARRLKPKYPGVAVDTLAYQYTQPAPNITKPEPNVIIRLCDISSNMGAPLTDPSNSLFAGIINAWFALTQRIYICKPHHCWEPGPRLNDQTSTSINCVLVRTDFGAAGGLAHPRTKFILGDSSKDCADRELRR